MALNFSDKVFLHRESWFYVISCCAGGLSLWAVHRWRLSVVIRRVRTLFDQRLSAQYRVARERQDELLQGMQGLILMFQGVAVQVPEESSLASQLEGALSRAEQLLIDRRDDPGDFCGYLCPVEALRDLAHGHGVRQEHYSFLVMGRERRLAPLICHEVYRTAQEALGVLSKSGLASYLCVTLTYRLRSLELTVQSDGGNHTGDIDPPFSTGPSTMTARAERLGGRLDILSPSTTEQQIRLTIPAEIAYASPPMFATRFLHRIRDFFQRRGSR